MFILKLFILFSTNPKTDRQQTIFYVYEHIYNKRLWHKLKQYRITDSWIYIYMKSPRQNNDFKLKSCILSAFKIASYAQFKCFIIFKDDRTY